MIGSTRNLRVWAWAAPADLRKGFDGLSGHVSSKLEREVLSGDCFLFVNRPRTRAKVLLWDGTGLCLYHKRLEQGRFAPLWPTATESVELTMSELSLYLEGCELVSRVELSPKAHVLGPIVVAARGERRGKASVG
jgi:transposase